MNSVRTVVRKLRGLMMRTMPLMLTCQELEDFMVYDIDGRLPDLQRSRFDLHLRLCRDCRRYFEAYKGGITLCQAAFAEPDGSLPEDVPEELVKAILLAREKDTESRR